VNTVRIVQENEYLDLAQHFQLHFLQSPQWGAFKSRHGWQPFLLGVFNSDGHCIGLGQYLKRRVIGSQCIAYFAKGPACDYSNQELVSQVISAINSFLKTYDQEIVFIRYEMDLIETLDGQSYTIDYRPLLRNVGCKKAPADVQYRDTRKLALGTMENTWEGFSSKQRNKIKVAAKKEVRIERCSNVATINEFFAVYQETAQRNNIFIHPLAYYQDFFTTFVGQGLAEFYAAWYQERMLSAAFIVHYGQESMYMYSGSIDWERNRRPNEAIQWEAIQEAIRRGATNYDFWGVAPWATLDHPWAGLSEFKAGFGGQHIRYIGCYDYPCKPLSYAVLVAVEKARNGLLQLKKALRQRPVAPSRSEAPQSNPDLSN
jgi:lipid II:glycine glycyltransferase (peptidoglycan interpeptide bridge formation enzyme)